MKYSELSRKEKQLIASQYPFKKDQDLFKSKYTVGNLQGDSDVMDFKYEASKEGVDLVKKSEYVQTSNGIVSVIDIVLGNMNPDAYSAALELAKIDFNAIDILKEIFSIEATRLRDGMEYEQSLGMGLQDETQSSLNSLVNIVKTISELEEGKKLSIDFNTSLSGMISSMDLDVIDTEAIENDKTID